MAAGKVVVTNEGVFCDLVDFGADLPTFIANPGVGLAIVVDDLHLNLPVSDGITRFAMTDGTRTLQFGGWDKGPVQMIGTRIRFTANSAVQLTGGAAGCKLDGYVRYHVEVSA